MLPKRLNKSLKKKLSLFISLIIIAVCLQYFSSHTQAFTSHRFARVLASQSVRIPQKIQLLDEPWIFSEDKELSKKSQAIDPTVLENKDTLAITYNLHGLCLLDGEGGEVSFIQDDTEASVSLRDYVTNCSDGMRLLKIPLKDIKGLDMSKNVSKITMTFWYPTKFVVDIPSITVYDSTGVLGAKTTRKVRRKKAFPTPTFIFTPSITPAVKQSEVMVTPMNTVTPIPTSVPTKILTPTKSAPTPTVKPTSTPTKTPTPIKSVSTATVKPTSSVLSAQTSPTTKPTLVQAKPTATRTPALTPTPIKSGPNPTRVLTKTPTPTLKLITPTLTKTLVTPTPTPTPTPLVMTTLSKSWAIQSVSSMKETKDKICTPDSSATITKWVAKAKELGANYVAIETPYDNPTCGSALSYTKSWIGAVRGQGLLVWHRHMPLSFEGIYNTPKTTGSDYISQITAYIKANAADFRAGDIFTPIPEPQNGGIAGVTYCASNVCQFSSKEAFNTWLRQVMTASENAFATIGLGGKIKVGYFGFDGFVAWGDNNPDWNGILEDATVQQMGNITIDHYPEILGETMAAGLDELQHRYPNVPIIIGEWGTVTGGDTELQVRTTMTAAKRPGVIGFNYWHMGMGGQEAIINDDFTDKVQFDDVQRFYKGL